ncbi:2'-5' RNA ligase family protein [Sphingomonas sp. 1P06PA]|uniref:2'-5' RNA ligase family protein n=1 Tax=Sphingomonas sp. 1P06PA TaxID=554121 RepID=UPI0039A4CF5D
MIDAAPIIVTATLGTADFAWADNLRRIHFPPERNHLSAHLTLFHHLPPSAADELDRRLAGIARSPRPDARIPGPMSLGRGVALKVESAALVAIRAELAEAFVGSLTLQDQAGWRPHITIQNKVDPATARALLATLQAGFAPRPLSITGLALWRYRGPGWDLIARHAFHG